MEKTDSKEKVENKEKKDNDVCHCRDDTDHSFYDNFDWIDFRREAENTEGADDFEVDEEDGEKRSDEDEEIDAVPSIAEIRSSVHEGTSRCHSNECFDSKEYRSDVEICVQEGDESIRRIIPQI